MKKQLLTLAVAAGLLAAGPAQAEVKVKWFGFAQVTGEQLDQRKSSNTDGMEFGTDRVRIGFKLKDGNVFGKLQIDFEKTDNPRQVGSVDEIIKDVEVGYKFSNAAKVKLGVFKTPIGMDFNGSGKKLDITKRGMEKSLVLERAPGIMLSGRKIANGFGYDIFYGNPSGRGSASVTRGADLTVVDTGTGDDLTASPAAAGSENTTVVRVMYDMGKMMHMELAIGKETSVGTMTITDSLGVVTTASVEDYEVMDFGFRFKSGPSTVKFEWIDGENVRGVKGNDEAVYYIHYGHMIGKKTELVARYYNADQSRGSGAPDSDRQNTYLGANFFLGSNKTNGRVQVNYVIVGGDDIDSTNPYTGRAAGYSDNALLTQYQMSF